MRASTSVPQLQQGRRPATASPAARRQTGGGSNAYEQQFGASAGFQGLSTSATSSLLMSASEVRDLHNRISADNRHRAERMRDHGYLVGDRGRVAIKSPPTKLGVHWRQGGRAGAPGAQCFVRWSRNNRGSVHRSAAVQHFARAMRCKIAMRHGFFDHGSRAGSVYSHPEKPCEAELEG